MTHNGAIPWALWMSHGFGRLKLTPDMFWRLSVTEWRAVLGQNDHSQISRAELNKLIQEFPDVPQ